MRGVFLIASAGLLAAGAYVLWKQSEAEADEYEAGSYAGGWLATAESVLQSATEETAQFLEVISMGTLRLSAMRDVTAQDVANQNVQAFLRVLRRGEGTSGPNGYRTLFGGGLFESYAQHPNQKITRTFKNGLTVTSTAAGAYQFLKSTWDETARIMGLADFTPANQDRGAVGRIAARGALADVKAGRFDVAIQKVAREWASMPGSPYGQPVISLTTARAVYAESGGVFA